jgi:hypothetical protein
MSSSQRSDPRNSGIYRTIRIVFGADLAIGLVLTLANYLFWDALELWIIGPGLAAIGLLMLWLFPLLLRRAEERDRGSPAP